MADPLFDHLSIGPLGLPNRIVRSATHDYRANSDGSPSAEQFGIYTQLSQHDIGLIISGFLYVAPNGTCAPGQFALLDDSDLALFRRLTAAVHDNGGRIVAQLALGGRQCRRETKSAPAGVPSMLPGDNPGELREMTPDDIEQAIRDFIRAAGQTREAGFDGVQLHAAHGYLLSQFLSPVTNKRTDEWGGSIENRARILVRTVQGIKSKTGAFPVLVKLNGDDGGIPGGLTIDDSTKAACLLEHAGLDAVEVSRGMKGSPQPTVVNSINTPEKEAYLLPLAATMKKHLSIPVISVGGFRSAAVMRQALSSGVCDLVSLSRPFVCEPDLVQKLKAGKQKADCISCSRCFNPRGIRCAIKKSPVDQS